VPEVAVLLGGQRSKQLALAHCPCALRDGFLVRLHGEIRTSSPCTAVVFEILGSCRAENGTGLWCKFEKQNGGRSFPVSASKEGHHGSSSKPSGGRLSLLLGVFFRGIAVPMSVYAITVQ